jgi:hypothetical protein
MSTLNAKNSTKTDLAHQTLLAIPFLWLYRLFPIISPAFNFYITDKLYHMPPDTIFLNCHVKEYLQYIDLVIVIDFIHLQDLIIYRIAFC